MKFVSVVNLLAILVFLFICYAGASPITTPARRTQRSSCPRNITMICPTAEKHFVVNSSRKGRRCEFDEPIMVTALRDCNNSVMDVCRDKWVERNSNCSAPIIKQIVDYSFQGACFLHDLCYSSWYTKRKDCDDWFLRNMKEMCSTRRSWSSRLLCKGGAHVVYLAVRGFGGFGFKNAKRWTEKICTSNNTCPRNISMICPTEKKYFVVHSSWDGLSCKFDEPIAVTALRECDNSVMNTCKDRWVTKPDNCSAPVIKGIVDYAFQGACFLHDLCYLSWNTEQEDCDDWFLHNMKQMCSIHRSWFTCFLCNGSANTVYLAVRSFGRIKFDEAKNWTLRENCTSKVNSTKAPTLESYGSGIGSGSGSGRPVLPDEQSTEQTDLESSDENSPKPEQTEPTQSSKQNEQLDEPLH